MADASRRTTKQNAYVSGLGRTRRLVLYDTLLAEGDPRELRIVLAHELGHRRAGHIVKGTALGVAGAAVFVLILWALLRWPPLLDALGVVGLGDPRSCLSCCCSEPSSRSSARLSARRAVATLGARGRQDLARADSRPRGVRADDAEARARQPRRPRPTARSSISRSSATRRLPSGSARHAPSPTFPPARPGPEREQRFAPAARPHRVRPRRPQAGAAAQPGRVGVTSPSRGLSGRLRRRNRRRLAG